MNEKLFEVVVVVLLWLISDSARGRHEHKSEEVVAQTIKYHHQQKRNGTIDQCND